MAHELMQLHKNMEYCPATGWAGFQTYLLHRMNGSLVNGEPQYYYGDCELSCERNSLKYGNVYQYESYFECIFKHYRRLGFGHNWHVEFEKRIPGL